MKKVTGAWFESTAPRHYKEEQMKKSYVRVPCECGCSTLEFMRVDWDDNTTYYNVCVLDSRYDHHVNGIIDRLRRAFGVLFSKPVYFNDVCLDSESFHTMVDELDALDGMAG